MLRHLRSSINVLTAYVCTSMQNGFGVLCCDIYHCRKFGLIWHEYSWNKYIYPFPFKDIVMNMKTYPYMFEQEPDIRMKPDRPKDTHYITSTTHMDPPGWTKIYCLFISSSEPKAHRWAYPSSVRQHFQTNSPPKPWSRFFPYFTYSIYM